MLLLFNERCAKNEMEMKRDINFITVIRSCLTLIKYFMLLNLKYVMITLLSHVHDEIISLLRHNPSYDKREHVGFPTSINL